MKKLKFLCVLAVALLLSSCAISNIANKRKQEEIDTKISESIIETDDSYYDFSEEDNDGYVEVFETEYGNFELTLPDGWEEYYDGDDTWDIDLENYANDEYFGLLSVPKEDYADFNAFKNIAFDFQSEGSYQEISTDKVSYNGLNGERKCFYLTVDGLNIFYVIDILEGKNFYIESLTWTAKSKEKKYKADLIQLMESLKELP